MKPRKLRFRKLELVDWKGVVELMERYFGSRSDPYGKAEKKS